MADVSSDDESDLPRDRRLPEGELNTTNAGRHAILFKVPAQLAKSWQQQRDAGSKELVGQLTTTWDLLNPQAPPQPNLKVPGKDGELSPTTYEFKPVKDFRANMFVFSEAADATLEAEGTVTNKLLVTQRDDLANLNKYRKVFRERQSKASCRRTSKVFENDRGKYVEASGEEGLISRPRAAKAKKDKRFRGDLTEVRDLLFELFEVNSNWDIDDLIHETKQPEKFLKEILADLCIYNKSGFNKGTFELKPEYKPRSEEDEEEEEG